MDPQAQFARHGLALSRLIEGVIAGCLLALLATTVAAHPPVVLKSPPSQTGLAMSQAAQDLTLALVDASTQLAAAGPANRGQALAKLVAAARSRHDAILALLDVDPTEAYRVALPANLRTQFPGEAAPFVERDAQEDGELEVFHVDHVDPTLDHYLYFLNTAQHGRLSLYFVGKPPVQVTGSYVRVNGLKIDNALLATSTENALSPKAARTTTKLPSTLGAQQTLTILVNFTDDTSQPFTVASAQSMMFTTVSDYWYEASYQQTTLAGAVAGWFTIPLSTATCDYTSIASYAKQAAVKAGFILSQYTRFLYAFPGSSCPWWGLSYVGGNPSESWIAVRQGFTLTVIGHELGHALGLYHSHSLDCGTVELASSGCTAIEYGDMLDIMGGPGSSTPHYNAFQKEQLGWLNAGVSPPVTTASTQPGSVNYTIAPLELTRNTTPRALKIPRAAACGSTADYLYVESRQAVGFDSFLSGNSYALAGVLVHDATPGSPNSSYLLDMTPATASWQDAPLGAGIAFTDPASDFTITPVSVGGSATAINVSFPPATCTHSAPAIVVAPTGTVYTAAGGTATYSVTVTNNDTCNCSPSMFSVNASVPSGWSATSSQTASIAPGGSGSASLGITTANSAAAAFYTIPGTVTNATAGSFAASADAIVAVVTSLGVSVATDSSSYVRPTKHNQTMSALITTSVTSSGTPVSGATASVQVKNPTGAIATFSGTTSSDGIAYVSYPINSTSPLGIYTATSTAGLGTMSNTGTVSFSVN